MLRPHLTSPFRSRGQYSSAVSANTPPAINVRAVSSRRIYQNLQSPRASTQPANAALLTACATTHANTLRVRYSNQLYSAPQTRPASHWLCSAPKSATVTANDGHVKVPTGTRLKSSFTNQRIRNARHNNSSITGTTSTAPATRQPMNHHRPLGSNAAARLSFG